MSSKRIDPQALAAALGRSAEGPPPVDKLARVYRELLGHLPPRVEARFHVTGALDPLMVDLQEQARNHALYPACFDQKTAQLMVFGMLLMDLSDAAQTHALAARRAGASWAELQAVINLCYLFRGLSAANRGADMLAQLALSEQAAQGAQAAQASQGAQGAQAGHPTLAEAAR